jgi:integrase
MNQMTLEFLARSRAAFSTTVGLSLQDVRDQVAALPASTRRRDTLSALDAVPKLFKRNLAAVQADWISLRAVFTSKNAAQLGVSEKRFANIRSEVVKAVRAFGAGCPTLTKRLPLSPTWDALMASIDRLSYNQALRRLACFCSAMGIEPTEVSPETLLGLHEALVAEEVIKDPRRILNHTIGHWNMCRRRVPGWPAIRLTSPFASTRYVLDLVQFPESFQTDVAAWRRRLLEVDYLEGDGPEKVLRPITVNSQEKVIRRFASALIAKGVLAVEDIKSLADLAEPRILKVGLKIFLEKAGGKPTEYVRKYGWLFLSIAKHHAKLSDEQIKAIRVLVNRLGHREVGMTKRNRERLGQFDERENVVKLLTFPIKERARGLKVASPYRKAKYFERALSAAILIYASVRMQNLHTIQIEKNIRYSQGRCILTFDKTETKNSRPLELELPTQVASLLQEFIKDHRRVLPGAEGPYLFPGRSGGPRSHNTMRQDFEKSVLKHTGLVVNPHLMRHITAMIAIVQDPANLPAVAQRLGHAGLQTCIDFYLGNESKPSSRVINKILEDAIINPKGLG